MIVRRIVCDFKCDTFSHRSALEYEPGNAPENAPKPRHEHIKNAET